MSKYPFVTGNWIVVRIGGYDRPAETFGYIDSVSMNQSVNPGNGAVMTSISLNCIGWFDLFNNASIQVGKMNRLRDTGGLFQIDEFNQWVERTLSMSFINNQVGYPLLGVFKMLGKVRAPKTLTKFRSMWLGDAIPVIFNDTTAKLHTGTPTGPRKFINVAGAYDVRRYADPVPGPTLTAIQSSVGGGGGQTIMSLLQGSFMGDPGLMEMFPSLEDYGDTGSTLRNESVDNSMIMPALDNLPSGGLSNATHEKQIISMNQRLDGVASSVMGEALGRNPVLMYRMKPWRTEPLSHYVRTRLNRGQTLSPRIHTLFEDITWDIHNGPKVELNDILDIDFSKNDTQVQTIFTADPPLTSDNPLRYASAAGLPLIPSMEMLHKRGLREYQVKWPFLPDMANDNLARTDFISYALTLAALAAQYFAPQHNFMRGTATTTMRLDVRHGQPVTFGMHPSLGFDMNRMSAYVTSVTHTANMSDVGVGSYRTNIEFERGLSNEWLRTSPLTYPEKQTLKTLSSRTGHDIMEGEF